MVYIRCTQKLLKLLGVSPLEVEADERQEGFGDWYANLIWIEGKKCLLFTSERTLFSFLVPNVRKENLCDLGLVFRTNIKEALHTIKIPMSSIAQFLLALGEIRVGRTQNKSVFGSMNDYAFQYKIYVLQKDGLQNCDIADITRRVNDSPMRAIDYKSGETLIRQYLESHAT